MSLDLLFQRVYLGGYMNNILASIERENHIREIFLSMFREDGVSEQDLEKAICESYCEEGIECETIKDIPIKEMEEAIIECCESAGLAFETFDDILEYFYKNNN
jgi:predicted methyltransferase